VAEGTALEAATVAEAREGATASDESDADATGARSDADGGEAAVAAPTVSLSPVPTCGRSNITPATTAAVARRETPMTRRDGCRTGRSAQAVSRREGARTA
jgi:hypothetical protein